MKKAIKTKWLKALRSGKYRQDTAYLCLKGKYCCLGVLAEEIGALKDFEHSDGAVSCKGTRNAGGMLPARVLKKVGLSNYTARKLADFNDNHGWTFKAIANWIEENL